MPAHSRQFSGIVNVCIICEISPFIMEKRRTPSSPDTPIQAISKVIPFEVTNVIINLSPHYFGAKLLDTQDCVASRRPL